MLRVPRDLRRVKIGAAIGIASHPRKVREDGAPGNITSCTFIARSIAALG
jgi:hypothetical protein